MVLREVRRDIARLKTEIKKREIAGMDENEAGEERSRR
jgi:ribosomal protein L29